MKILKTTFDIIAEVLRMIYGLIYIVSLVLILIQVSLMKEKI